MKKPIPLRELFGAREKAGILALGATDASAFVHDAAILKAWTDLGANGDMAYLARDADRRASPESLLKGAKSVLTAFVPYLPPPKPAPKGFGEIAAFAAPPDYHAAVTEKLKMIADALKELDPSSESVIAVDSAPILERAASRRSGLGFIGKNRCLIVPGSGSFGNIGIIITSSRIETIFAERPSQPGLNCGSCRACIDACPAGALSETGFDARLCVAYLTIERKGVIPDDLARRFGARVFGCDACQTACPHNAERMRAAEADDCSANFLRVNLAEALAMTADDFSARYANTTIYRTGHKRFLRNCAIAARNCG